MFRANRIHDFDEGGETNTGICQGSTVHVKFGGAAQCGGGGVLTYIPNITRTSSIMVKIVWWSI